MRVAGLMASMLIVLIVAPVRAQRPATGSSPQTAVLPEAVTVGDVFHAAIRLQLPVGVRAVFPDTLSVPTDVEAAGRRTIRVDTVDNRVVYTVSYPLTAWRPDSLVLLPAQIEVVTGRNQDRLSAPFPVIAIRSVLPADTAGIQPEPPKDVLGANRLLWPILLALVLLLALLVFAWWRYRKRRPRPQEEVKALGSPRDLALEALDRARNAGLVEAGAMKEFYSLVSEALRQYLDRIEPRWGADLTSSELAGRMRGMADEVDVAAVVTVLGEADLVKFARRSTTADDALAKWSMARKWVERFDWPAPVPEAVAA